jgi:hypothetical protein
MDISIVAVKTIYLRWWKYITAAITSSCGYMTNVVQDGKPDVMIVKVKTTQMIPGYWRTGYSKTPDFYFHTNITWKIFTEQEAVFRTQEAFPGQEDEVVAIIKGDYVALEDFMAEMTKHLTLARSNMLKFCMSQYRLRLQGIQDIRCHDATLVVWQELLRKNKEKGAVAIG